MVAKIAKKEPLIVAILQARMGSTRLPGKTLADICGRPLLSHIIERVGYSLFIRKIIVATTKLREDRAILALASSLGVSRYAGSAEDVLDRYYKAAKYAGADIVVRITGDDPFKDAQIIDRVIKYFLLHPTLDYASNTIRPTYPEGLDVEVFSFRALKKAWKEGILKSEREHVTPFIWKNPSKFQLANIENEKDLSGLRWTVDYPEDLEFAREIYARLYPKKKCFSMEDILALLERETHIEKINRGFPRQAGYLQSLQKDQTVKTIERS